MTKFNKQEMISEIGKSEMHPTEAEGQKPVLGIMHLVKMEKAH